jgi:cell division GTPase FtsZ
MTREELEEIFEDEDTSWEGDNAFQGLQILSKYTDELIVGANHDIIYSADVDKVLEAGLTKEDAMKLRKLNWMIEENGDYFACFV